MNNVHGLSLLTVMVTLRSGEKTVSQGTGFFYKKDDVMFLATNYHVITGISPSDREKKQIMGDNISIKLRGTDGKSFITNLPLFFGNYHNWLEHPSDEDADLVLIPIPFDVLKDVDFTFVDYSVKLKNLLLSPSSPVVLLGYPHGFSDSVNNLPIWKTGSLASEPLYDFDGKKVILADVSAFPGMSGSPVFYVAHSGYVTTNGNINVGGGMHIHFLGIFASMQVFNSDLYLEQVSSSSGYKVSHSESLQLGYVWKSELIEEVASSFKQDTYPVKYERRILKKMSSGFECKF